MPLVFINCTGETFTPTRSGAICTWIWEVCRAAQREGIEPWVITRSTDQEPHPWSKLIVLDYPWIPQVRGTGIGRVLRIQQQLTGWGHIRQKAYINRVLHAIRAHGLERMPFVLHNDPEMAVHLRRCFPKATIVHLFHNTNTCHENFRRPYGAAVDVAAGVSDYVSRWQGEYFGIEGPRLRTIYSGVDLDRFVPAERPPDGPVVINFVGRTDATKAPDLLLRAVRQVATKHRDISLQILGARYYWGTAPDDYQRLIESLSCELEAEGIPVRRPGVIDRHALPAELRKAHIHVVPSRWDEPFGLVTLEGMASGLAVVASRTGGTPEVVNGAGLLFERDSEEELAAHLTTLIEDVKLRGDFATRARARAEKFSWDNTWQDIRKAVGV
jgi:glycosyltransferase involved in cell wall biosynthesis